MMSPPPVLSSTWPAWSRRISPRPVWKCNSPRRPVQRTAPRSASPRMCEPAGRLQITAPKGWKRYTPLGGREAIDLQIDLPAGSHLRGEADLGAVRCTGRLGEVHLKTGLGEIRLDQAGQVELKTGGGDIIVDQVADHAELRTGTGAVQARSIGGSAVVKNGNGDTWIGEVVGELRVSAANG